jgi:N-acetylglutamate synthase-like GNAT family acetyltransferase
MQIHPRPQGRERPASGPTIAYRIRKARKPDWPKIVTLNSRHNRPDREDSTVFDYFVALVAREIVGAAAIHLKGTTGYIYGLVVANGWRRKGIGHALTGACLEHIRHSGAERVLAFAMFWNVRFFRRHGFSPIKRASLSEPSSLHGDFSKEWCRHSTLLCADLPAREAILK